MSYFKVKTQSLELVANEKGKMVQEKHNVMVEANSGVEASTIAQELFPNSDVTACVMQEHVEVCAMKNDEESVYCKVKVKQQIDEDKKSIWYWYFGAKDQCEAQKKAVEYIKQGYEDFSIVGCNVTSIENIYPIA